MIYTHVAAFVLGLVIAATGTWQTQNWRYGVQIAKLKRENAEAVAKAQTEYRAKEQALIKGKQDAEVRYAQLKKRFDASAAGARSELDKLRDDLAARSAAPNSPSESRANGGTGLERELLGACAKALVGMAGEADRMEAMVVGLQSYIKNVCLKANQ